MNAEVGATRPVVYSRWVAHDALVGQAGKHIKPRVLFSFGISGAIQHRAGQVLHQPRGQQREMGVVVMGNESL